MFDPTIYGSGSGPPTSMPDKSPSNKSQDQTESIKFKVTEYVLPKVIQCFISLQLFNSLMLKSSHHLLY